MGSILFAVLLAGCGAFQDTSNRPQALARLEQVRAGLSTGELVTSEVDYQFAAKSGQTPREVFHDIRFAVDRQISVNRGDASGAVILTPEGKPNELLGRIPFLEYQAPGLVMQRPDDPLSVMFVREHAKPFRDDVRTLGIAAFRSGMDVHDTLSYQGNPNPEAIHYNEKRDGDLHVVEARCGKRTVTYWLDPERGWSPVRVRETGDDGWWAESKSTLELRDGVWFPSAVECYSSQHKQGAEPAMLHRVHSAVFNDPNHQQNLTPADIGVEPGMLAANISSVPHVSGKWDGTNVVSMSEFSRRLAKGEVTEGSRFVQAVVRGHSRDTNELRAAVGNDGPDASKLRPVEDIEGLWEAYVRQFIQKYRLGDDQRQKAQSILKECQERAKDYVAKRRSDFETLERSRKALLELSGDDKLKATRELTRTEAHIRRPIDDIFERQLKPRLEALPTRAQREAVGESKSK